MDDRERHFAAKVTKVTKVTKDAKDAKGAKQCEGRHQAKKDMPIRSESKPLELSLLPFLPFVTSL